MSKYFSISGFWKDDKLKFSDYIVKEDDGIESDEEDELIFYYGLSEEDIKEAIKEKWSSEFDFVITDYKEIEL